MARKYVIETNQGRWNESDVEKAIQEAAKDLYSRDIEIRHSVCNAVQTCEKLVR